MTAPAAADVAPADVTTTPTAPPVVVEAPAATPPAPAAADVDEPARPRRGQAVTFTFRDVITGQQLDGAGVVLDVDEDQAVIVPTASHYLYVPLGDVRAVELGD